MDNCRGYDRDGSEGRGPRTKTLAGLGKRVSSLTLILTVGIFLDYEECRMVNFVRARLDVR